MNTKLDDSRVWRGQVWFVQCAMVVATLVGSGCSGEENTNGNLTISSVTIPCEEKAWSDEVCIPGGEFIMGHDLVPYEPPPCPSGQQCGPGNPPREDYAPRHKVQLSPYFIDRLPATNKQYRACFDAGQCEEDCATTKHCTGGIFDEYNIHDPQLDDFPALTVGFDGVAQYCKWMGKRLPTEAEWERAARGRLSNDYPWGNDAPDCSKYACDLAPMPLGWTRLWSVPVGGNTSDISPEGVHEMVTNSRNFVADSYDSAFYGRSPSTNPLANGSGNNVIRGDLTFHDAINDGVVAFHGTRFPSTAWSRMYRLPGGPRCARTDVTSASAGEQFFLIRQRVLRGDSLAAKGGAQ